MTEKLTGTKGPSTSEGEDMATAAALKAAKKELRSAMKSKLSSISKSTLDSQSTKVFKSLSELKPYSEAKRMSVYLSMPSGEIQTDQIVRDALRRGKSVFVPYLYKNEAAEGPKKVMDMVKLRDVQDYEGLEKDSWGIPSINAESVKGRERILNGEEGDHVVEGLDMVFMPGVAFEEDGGVVQRLGHGKGFYDFFLHRYQQAYKMREETKPVQLYGFALEEQFLKGETSQIPVGPHDSPLNGLLVGDGRTIESGIS